MGLGRLHEPAMLTDPRGRSNLSRTHTCPRSCGCHLLSSSRKQNGCPPDISWEILPLPKEMLLISVFRWNDGGCRHRGRRHPKKHPQEPQASLGARTEEAAALEQRPQSQQRRSVGVSVTSTGRSPPPGPNTPCCSYRRRHCPGLGALRAWMIFLCVSPFWKMSGKKEQLLFL